MSSKYSLSISTRHPRRIVPSLIGSEAADVAVEDVQLQHQLTAFFHLELPADHLLGDVRRDQAHEPLPQNNLLFDFLREDGVLDEHRCLACDRSDDFEVLGLKLRKRFGVEPQHPEDFLFVVVQERHDHGARESDSRIIDLPFEAAKSKEASWVSTPARSWITWFRMVELTWMGESLPSRRRAARGAGFRSVSRRKMTPRSAFGELEERQQIRREAIQVAFETDVSRKLPADAQSLVIEPELLGIVAHGFERQEPFVCAAICVPMARAASSTSTRVARRGPVKGVGCAAGLPCGWGDRNWVMGADDRERDPQKVKPPARVRAVLVAPSSTAGHDEPRVAACWTAPGPTGGGGNAVPDSSSNRARVEPRAISSPCLR